MKLQKEQRSKSTHKPQLNVEFKLEQNTSNNNNKNAIYLLIYPRSIKYVKSTKQEKSPLARCPGSGGITYIH